MKTVDYTLRWTNEIISPSLVYYKDAIMQNNRLLIEIAGGPEKLWPHVKTHKTKEIVSLQMELGITRFKCATIAELEMVASAKAPHALLAYPLIGPNVRRFIQLSQAYSDTTVWAIGDNFEQLSLLAQAAEQAGRLVPVLIDVNMGTNRTGVPIEKLQLLYEQCVMLKGLEICGLHCYDGNRHERDFDERNQAVVEWNNRVRAVQSALKQKGIACDVMLMGGTPSFPCHAKNSEEYFSPGTAVIYDAGYGQSLPDLDFIPAAAILTRVVSHPEEGFFTLDLGCKGIACDPDGLRGILVGMENAVPMLQNEEHWVYKMKEGLEAQVPAIGSVFYVIPTHICPTSALYKSVLVAKNGEIIAEWKVAARDRQLTY